MYHAVTVGADGSGNICIHCTISSLSDALGCVVLLHPVNDLSNITVREVIRGLQQPYCINVDRDIYSVAVFEWKRDGFLSFQPAVIKVTAFDQPSNFHYQYRYMYRLHPPPPPPPPHFQYLRFKIQSVIENFY